MAELRSHSTRARITPTSFVNDYSWGDFKGNVDRWIDEYFDAFVYLANWGTRELKLRLPAGLLDEKLAELCCVGDSFWMRKANGRTVLTFLSEDEDDGEWVEGEGWLASLVGLRSELARGDVRALYLGWLHGAQNGFLEDDDLEPPVPPGLARLSGSLESLVRFLRIDPDLVDVAATSSPARSDSEPRSADVRQWLASLTLAEKDEFLARLVTASDSAVRFELVQRFEKKSETCGIRAGRRRSGEPLATLSAMPSWRRRSGTASNRKRPPKRKLCESVKQLSPGHGILMSSMPGNPRSGTRSRT